MSTAFLDEGTVDLLTLKPFLRAAVQPLDVSVSGSTYGVHTVLYTLHNFGGHRRRTVHTCDEVMQDGGQS